MIDAYVSNKLKKVDEVQYDDNNQGGTQAGYLATATAAT